MPSDWTSRSWFGHVEIVPQTEWPAGANHAARVSRAPSQVPDTDPVKPGLLGFHLWLLPDALPFRGGDPAHGLVSCHDMRMRTEPQAPPAGPQTPARTRFVPVREHKSLPRVRARR